MVLYVHGGIYTDIDTDPLKPLDPLMNLNKDLIIGIECGPKYFGDKFFYKKWGGGYPKLNGFILQYCQWTIIAKPGNKILLDAINRSCQAILKYRHRRKSNMSTLVTTGPIMWTYCINKYLNYANKEERKKLKFLMKNFFVR